VKKIFINKPKMFVRYPYRPNTSYRGRMASMEIDRDEEPIWVTPLDKKIFQGNNKMKNRYTISKMDVLKAKNKKKNGKIEDQKNLINYIQKKTSSEKSKCEDEEQITESESDYDEDNISTKDKICSEYQNHNKFVKD